jgi:alkanesulfonate monooxygenase SsuD/methylene tetrahydromethanopterin reductase-like flavin-dependent oxidoreductase (luciferase family)
MIGGSGEKMTLRLVAQYADFCNVFGDPATVAHKFAVLRDHCARVGRPYDAITRSNHVSILIARDDTELAAKKRRFADRLPEDDGLIGTPDTIIAGLTAYAAVGSQYVTFTMPDVDDIAPIALLGDLVVPAVAQV